MFKRSQMILVALLVLAMVAPAAARPAAFPGHGGRSPVFADIEGLWAQHQIERMFAAGLVVGTGDGFEPHGLLTRAQVAVMFVRALGLEGEAETGGPPWVPQFTDESVFPGWARNHIRVCFAHRLMLGELHPSGKVFNPNKPMTREELVVLLLRALDEDDAVADAEATAAVELAEMFRDHKAISAWARASVLVAWQLGLISGYQDRTFQPQKPVSRAEAAVLLDRCAPYMEQTWPGVLSGTLQEPVETTITLLDQDEATHELELHEGVQVYVSPMVQADLADLQVGWWLTVYAREGKAYYIRARLDLEEITAEFVSAADGKITVLITSETEPTIYQLAGLVELPAGLEAGDLLELEVYDDIIYKLEAVDD